MNPVPTEAQILIARCIAAVFLGLALLHLYWAAGERRGFEAAVPRLADGVPAFTPSRAMTACVAIALLACAAVVWANGDARGAMLQPIPRWLCSALGVVMLLRAVGDFRLVGFFKRLRHSRFARLDTRYYSPLCLTLGIACLWIAT